MEDREHSKRLLDRVREAIRVRHYSIRTENTYVDWIRRFVLFHDKRHPEQMREPEVARFLTHLAVDEQVAPATQNQALNALVFLYRAVLDRHLEEIHGVVAFPNVKSEVTRQRELSQESNAAGELAPVHEVAGAPPVHRVVVDAPHP